MSLDELQAFIDQQVGERALELADLTLDFELGVDRPVAAVSEAEEDVEPLSRRVEMVAGSEVPLARQHGRITKALEQLRPGDRRRRQAKVRLIAGINPVGDAQLAGVSAGHQSGSRRRTNRSDRERIPKDRPPPRQAVEVGRLDLPVAIRAQGPLGLVVGAEKHNVGPRPRDSRLIFIGHRLHYDRRIRENQGNEGQGLG